LSKQIIEYHVQAENSQRKGHPIRLIEYFEELAVAAFDGLCEQFPYDTIRFFTVTKEEINTRKAAQMPLPEPKCPLGHYGKQDGRDIVFRNSQGKVNCRVCGYVGG